MELIHNAMSTPNVLSKLSLNLDFVTTRTQQDNLKRYCNHSSYQRRNQDQFFAQLRKKVNVNNTAFLYLHTSHRWSGMRLVRKSVHYCGSWAISGAPLKHWKGCKNPVINNTLLFVQNKSNATPPHLNIDWISLNKMQLLKHSDWLKKLASLNKTNKQTNKNTREGLLFLKR